MRCFLIPLAVGALLCAPASAEAAPPPPMVAAQVVSVYDGDSFAVEAAIWPGLTWKGYVRIRGVDTPEIRGKCEAEKELAQAARDYVVGRLVQMANRRVTLVDVKLGKFAGRVVATVLYAFEGEMYNVSKGLIEAKLGRAYDGTGPRSEWC